LTPIVWRRAGPSDAPTLSALGGATFLTTFAHDHPGDGLMAHIANNHSVAYYDAALADPAGITIIGETPMGAPVGYAMLTPNALPVAGQAGDYEIKRFYLLGPWQGGENGNALMVECLRAVEERGTRRLLLAVYPQNARARRFYERHGFAHIGTTTFMVGDTAFEDLIYARPMKADAAVQASASASV